MHNYGLGILFSNESRGKNQNIALGVLLKTFELFLLMMNAKICKDKIMDHKVYITSL